MRQHWKSQPLYRPSSWFHWYFTYKCSIFSKSQKLIPTLHPAGSLPVVMRFEACWTSDEAPGGFLTSAHTHTHAAPVKHRKRGGIYIYLSWLDVLVTPEMLEKNNKNSRISMDFRPMNLIPRKILMYAGIQGHVACLFSNTNYLSWRFFRRKLQAVTL